MKTISNLLLISLAILSLTANISALAQGTALTIYNNNFAVVTETRQLDFAKGVGTTSFAGVAKSIEPASIKLQCLSKTDPITILEQNYEYDLLNTNTMLNKYINKEVTIFLKGSGSDQGKVLNGTLLAHIGNDLILNITSYDRIHLVNKMNVEDIVINEKTTDITTVPTIYWLTEAEKAGPRLCRINYTTARLSWKADYSAELNADETKLNLNAFATIDNKSGADFTNAEIKLIAGDVKKVTDIRPRPMAAYSRMEMAAPAFKEKSFMEYHLYTLDRKSSIIDDQIKQIPLLPPAYDIPVKKLFIYDRAEQQDKVQLKIEFENKKENNLGIPLPGGIVRVYKKDTGSLQFVGEDRISHTPEDEKVLLHIGNAFDVVPQYSMLDSKADRRSTTQTHKIELRNRKTQAVTVFVDEKFPAHVNWTIDKATHKYNKRTAQSIRFEIPIAAGATQTIQYTATQKW